MFGLTRVSPDVVAVGRDTVSGPTAAVWRSRDGSTWTAVSSSSFAGESDVGMESAVQLDNGIVLSVGNSGGDAAIWESKQP